jgi:hypothetical protein
MLYAPKWEQQERERERTADWEENQFTLQDLCDYHHERRVAARFQTLLEAVDSNRWKNKTTWITEINKFLEIERGLRKW